MDSVVGDDLTLPVDINGSCRLPDSIDAGEYSTDSMTAPSFPDKMSPIKALTMKDYENQITALKKENFNLKLRIYFMEERMQQKCDDSTEDIFKTNIELKVELESMKRDLAEKQELLVSASKALESLAGRESGEPQRLREQAQREMDALRDAFNKRIAHLEQCLRAAEEEVENMAAIAEQEKLKNINMEKQLHALGPPSTFIPVPSPVQDLQVALQEKDNIIEQLKITLKDQEAVIHQKKCTDQATDAPSPDCVKKLSDLIAKKDQELEALRDELHREKDQTTPDHQDEHNSQIQKLQAEKDHLIQCIVHIYKKNNPSLDKSDYEITSCKTLLRSSGVGSPDDEAVCQLASEGQQFRESGSGHMENRMKRCVSLDQIVSKGAFPGRSGLRSSRLGSAAGLDGSMKSFGLRGTRHHSQSMYLDLVHRKGILPRPGFKSRSTSLQSLNRDFSSDTPPDPPPKLKLREAVSVARHGATDDPGGKVQARALLCSSSSQPSVISDLIQLLRCISKQQVSVPAGSHIPVLKRLNSGPHNPQAKRRHREAEWKSLHDLTEEFDDEYTPVSVKKQSEVSRLESCNKLLTEELTQEKNTNENLTKTLEDTQNQNKSMLGKLEEKENELNSEKKNALKRDKTIQGLTQVLREKEKEIAELCHEIEDRDDALAKAREAAHKAQLQKYQGVEEHQNLLMEKQTELAQLQGEHHAKVLEAQKLQRALDRKEQELADLQQAKDQLEVELEDLQQQKKKGDKALNDMNNQLKKLSGEIGDRESALEQQYQELLDQTKRKLQAHEVTIQRLTSTLADKEQQLQEYINMIRDFEQSKSPGGNDNVLSKLRQRLKEKERALEQALDEKFAAIEEKDNEIHQLQLSLREKERDLDRLNNLLSHNEETINSFDSLIKGKDVELQHLANTLKNLQRAKQDVEDNLNRSLREKDSIISQLQLSLEGKTKDMEEMAKSMLSQSQTHARDLAEQMGQRLKVTEAMLAEAVKARERLVADNESAVEGLLATIGSKDQLLKESAEHYNRMLSERAQEIEQLRKQLSDRQQQLATAEKQSSTKAQEGYLETAELKALLAEKESLINKLLQRGQERDQFLTEMRQKEEPDHVLELRQTIQIMQEKLDEREAELSRRNSEDNVENISLSKKTVVVLKKELAQKTEALNKALKRENELKISLAELQSLLSELEGRNEGQAAHIESLTATLTTKDEIINVLHQRLGQRGDSRAEHTQDQVIGTGMERLPGLPQRERTMIGGDSQQEALPNLTALQQEHDALNKALRAEQQLYSSLVRTVKEQDSAQRLHALQLELTAVQLLRQQLEESIKTNEELRDDLEREIQRAKLREGMGLIDPKELESMRHQLEDAQRWNASLQARLGAIQNRGGGVGGANDGGDTLSFIGDQTSYMSICVGEGQDDSLSLLSAQELRHKVVELQDCVSRLQTLNNELQNRLSLLEMSEHDAYDKEDKDLASNSPWKQLEKMQEMQPVAHREQTHQSGQDKESQTDIKIGQMVSGKLLVEMSMDSGLGQSREHAQSGNDTLDTREKDSREGNTHVMALKSLLTECGATSVSHLRQELLRLRSENVELRGLLKEQQSTECKEKESTDASGNNSDGQAELRKSVETLQAESKGHSKVINLLKEVSDGETPVTIELIVSTTEGTERPQTEDESHSKSAKQHAPRHGAGVKSRLPVPVRLRVEASSSRQSVTSDCLKTDALQHLHMDDVYGSDQQLHADSNSPMSPQHSTSSSSTPRYAHCSSIPVESDKGSEARETLDQTQADSAELFTQLELLHQECQEKEALIHKLSKQLADWEELHAQLQEKDRLNRQYVEALQAAESTIAYLTACSLDSQGGFGTHTNSCTGSGPVDSDAALHGRCIELQKALQEKEELNNQLIQLLSMAEKAITSPDNQEKNPENSDLCLKIETALQQVNAFSNRRSLRGVFGSTEDSMQELQQHTDSLQEALWEQNRLNAELQEKLRAADAAAQHGYNSNSPDQHGKCSRQIVAESEKESKEHQWEIGSCENVSLNQETTKVLLNCLSAAESAVASLASHCTNTSSLASGRSSQTSPDLQMNLDKLQRALQKRKELGEPTQPTTKSSSNQSDASSGTKGQLHQELHNNLCRLYKVFSDHSQRLSELQASLEERGRREESEVHRTVQDARGLTPIVQLQLETLHKALREKKKACKSLEEKLATALTKTPSPETARKALEHDDKGVQVDLQDLGYETSGKSENDREESSSTDLEVGGNPSCSASSLPSLLKHEQATFSSTENLDSTFSTPYPSSPALSSAKVSLKSLQVYDEYGVSEDPLELQGQVRELKVQLENQTKVIVQMQSLLRRNSLSSDLFANTSDPSTARDREGTQREDHSQDRSYRSVQLREEKEGENQAMKDKTSHLNMELERERTLNRSRSEPLQQTRSRSTSPARLDSLVQSQARELSQLRQQIKESRRLGALQRRQLEELSKAFKELLQASEVDYYMGEVVKDQLNKSLGILDRLEGRLDKGKSHLDNEDVAALELSRRLAKELREKNCLIQSLQNQLRGQSSSSHHSSHSDLYHSDKTSSSCYSSTATQGGNQAHSQRHPTDWTGAAVSPVGGAQEEGVSVRLQGLQRENGRLQEQLRGSEELNATLRSELDLHRSIMAQTSSHHREQDPGHDQDRSEPQTDTHKRDGDIGSTKNAAEQPRTMNSDLLAEHLQEIRALRQRLEESIRTNDRLREQLEKRLAEVEKDPAATNIFIQGNEDQGQLANEVRFLWGQNQALKEQLNMGSRDKQKENEKLRETLTRRTAKLDQSRRECEALRQENSRLAERLEHSSQENSQLQDSLHYSKEELHRLQCEVKLQRQQLSDSQHLLQSLRVELHVYEKMKTEAQKHKAESSEATQEPVSVPSSGSVDLSELLLEIRHLRLQLERSIQTNTALRQRLEEQLLRGPNRSETININYLLSSPDEGGRSPGREGCDLLRRSFQSHNEHTSVLHDETRHAHSEVDGSFSSSSGDSISGTPSRLVPGHRMWANRNGRHILGLIEDYNALRKQISEGRKLSRSMDTQLQECLHTLRQQGSDNKVIEQQHLKSLSGSMNTMQQVLEEAGRMLKLVWRVSLPAGNTAGDSGNNQQDELLKNEIARLKSRLSQQERMLSGAVKRLRTTNQLKEGMERVIIDQLCVTHGVLKKARGNLETNYCTLFGLKGLSGGPDEGGPSQWRVGDPQPEQMCVPVSGQTAGGHSGSSEDHNSDASLHCSY
ncbi:CDK5 regulatory subunit-associated protein 2 isoform X3 [Siniperca chuatsi]|uniref:CDK5 regulatory subunit-associated protein 2 isoform X3 n=1 Tax=Siniperca chuatsi TaxID=119488 RepID=UPI001CE0BF5C|nr:CDK5 regulatory subunit-associated protein 2 isoform X3 [Siniperca chuatsi]